MRLSGISRSLAALQVLPSTLTGAIGWKTLSRRQKMFASVLDETNRSGENPDFLGLFTIGFFGVLRLSEWKSKG